MMLPEGWRVGQDTKVSDQWLREFPEYTKQAATPDDIRMLRIVLESRRAWCFPHTIKRLSSALVDRGRVLGVEIAPVVPSEPEAQWHQQFKSPETTPPKMQPDPVDITARIVGEGDR